ncbi:MAG: hypothetical protein ACTSWI_03460 [Alphaproteobacteria bacterium]
MVFDRIDRGLKPWHVIAVVVIALGLGAIVGLATGPHIRDLTGLEPFGFRFNGYDFEEAVALLTALGSEGRSYYSGSHLIADTFFAPFLFLAVSSLFLWLTRPGQRFAVPLHENIRLIIIALAFVAFGMDILENVALWVVVGSGVEPAAGVVAGADLFSGVKWLAMAGALAGLLATIIIAVIRGAGSQNTASA